MSEGQGSDINSDTIYVRLLDEGTEVWRPVKAKKVAEHVYCIDEEQVPLDEKWEFQPGAVVQVRPHTGKDSVFLVAISVAALG